MSDLSRRNVLSLGVALGLVGAAGVAPAWGATQAGPAADPWWVWDDEIDRIMARILEAGEVPAVNTALKPWVDNNDPLPGGLPADLAGLPPRRPQAAVLGRPREVASRGGFQPAQGHLPVHAVRAR